MSERIGKLSAHIARKRRERLHEWTTAVQRAASDLTVVAPPVKAHTQSAKGSEKNWGAAVDTVAQVNRHVLSQAPASAVQMLAYKASEAGIRCDVVEDEAPAIAIGAALADAGRKVRRVARKIKKQGEDHYGDSTSHRASDHRQGDVAP